MRIGTHLTMLLSLLVLGTSCALSSGSLKTPVPSTPGGEGMSGTRHSRCVVVARADPRVLPLDSDMLASLFRSDAVVGKAAHEVLGVEASQESALFWIRRLGKGDHAAGESQDPNAGLTLTLALDVDLPRHIRPAAVQFSGALVENLRQVLQNVHADHVERLERQLAKAENERQAAQVDFADAMKQGTSQPKREVELDPQDARVHEQLDTVVDLSALSPEMPLREAIEIVKTSVEPPLNIVVFWEDLLDNADIKPTTAIGMDGLVGVRLGVGLDRLLDAVGGGLCDLDYVVDNGVVTAATVDSLPKKSMETRVYDVPPALRAADLTERLVTAIREGTRPESWFELSDMGEGTITPCGERLVILQTPEVHLQIQRLLDGLSGQFSIALQANPSEETLREQMRLLLAYSDKVTASQPSEERTRNIISELRGVVGSLETIGRQLRETESEGAQASDLWRVIDRVRSCIDQCSSRALVFSDIEFRWSPWEPSASELAFRGAQRRIAEIHRRLLGPRVFDPEVHRVQLAARRLELADNRVHDLQAQLASLRPPHVAAIGVH
jgi:hypothetical protein